MATKDRTSLKNDFANGKYATGEKFADLIDSMKVVQLPVVDPQALGTSLSFIDSISQDADGKITATKKTLDLANAHELNPFKGWYKTGDTLPTDGFDGAYLYFKDTSELTGQTTIYRWNGTAYADTGTVVDESNVQTFASGQAVNTVHIKNEKGEEVTGPADVLSAEAGKAILTIGDSGNDADLDIKDEGDFILARFSNGHFRTKFFNSVDVITKSIVELENNTESDFDIKDENNNVLARFVNGHIQVKNFNSEEIGKTHWYGKLWMGFGTSITNVSREGKYATYLAQISGLIFSNHGHSGGGITSYSNQSIYNDIMSADFTGYDLITLEVGANDSSAPLGTVYDGLSKSTVQDNSTFCGALNKCIRHLQANSNAQVVVMCSPFERYKRTNPSNVYDGDETSGPDNHTMLELNSAIQQVCMINSCWFIPAGAMDGFGYARMNASNNYNTDNVHHTNLGGYNFAQAIWAFLKNIPLFYQSI